MAPELRSGLHTGLHIHEFEKHNKEPQTAETGKQMWTEGKTGSIQGRTRFPEAGNPQVERYFASTRLFERMSVPVCVWRELAACVLCSSTTTDRQLRKRFCLTSHSKAATTQTHMRPPRSDSIFCRNEKAEGKERA